VSVNLPLDGGLAEGRSPPTTVNEPAKEGPPHATVESPPDVGAPPPAPPETKHEEPGRGSPAPTPNKQRRVSNPAESEVERLYYARHIDALGAPTCALASLEASTLPVQMQSRESADPRPEPTLWMDHVPTSGALLESACRRTYTGRR
jgi:hypothetical protein